MFSLQESIPSDRDCKVIFFEDRREDAKKSKRSKRDERDYFDSEGHEDDDHRH